MNQIPTVQTTVAVVCDTARPEAIIQNMIEKRNQFFAPSMQMKSQDISSEQVEDKYMDFAIESLPHKKPSKLSFRTLTFKKLGFSVVWKANALRIIYLITKFLIKIRIPTDQYKFKLMNPKIYQTLNDPSSDYYFYQLNDMIRHKVNRFQKILIKFNNYLDYMLHQKLKINMQNIRNYQIRIFDVIMPNSLFKIIWDTIVLAMIVLNIFYIPMKLSFQLGARQDDILVDFFLDTLPSWVVYLQSLFQVFVCEILLNFNTAIYHEGMIHNKRKDIFKYYIRGDFIWDLLVVIPFLISRFNVPYMEFVLLMRVTRVSSMFENLEQVTSIREKFAATLDIGKLIYFLIFICHICACSWHYLGVIELKGSNKLSWILRYGLEDEDWLTRYIYSFYWSTITTLTVGYGDITPKTKAEMVFATMMVLLASIVFGYTLSTIQTIFATVKGKSDAFKNKMAIINSYIKSRKLNKELQLKVSKYFEYYLRTYNENEEWKQLMSQLNNELKNSVQADIYFPIISRSNLLQSNFSELFLNQLCQKMTVSKYIPGEVLFEKGTQLDKIIFILNGEVQTYTQSKSNQLFIKQKILPKQQIQTFQRMEVKQEVKIFLYKKELNFQGQPNLLQRLLKQHFKQNIKKFASFGEDFIKLLKEFPKEYEKYAMLRDNLKYNPIFRRSNQQCSICDYNHAFIQCPYAFFQPNRQKLALSQLLSNQKQQRSQYMRNKQKEKVYFNKYIIKKYPKFKYQVQRIEAVTLLLDTKQLDESELTKELLKKYGLNSNEENEMGRPQDQYQLECFETSNIDKFSQTSYNESPARNNSEEIRGQQINNWNFNQEVPKIYLENEDYYNRRIPITEPRLINNNSSKGLDNYKINRSDKRKNTFEKLHSIQASKKGQFQLHSRQFREEQSDKMIKEFNMISCLFFEYLEFLKSDIIEIDLGNNFETYYPYFNLKNIIRKIDFDQRLSVSASKRQTNKRKSQTLRNKRDTILQSMHNTKRAQTQQVVKKRTTE